MSLDFGKQTNMDVSNVHDDEKTIATAVNVIFVKKHENQRINDCNS